MNHTNTTEAQHSSFELRFQSLAREGRAFVFPCDALGVVDLDRLSEHARNNYLLARTCIGRDFAWPAVVPAAVRLH